MLKQILVVQVAILVLFHSMHLCCCGQNDHADGMKRNALLLVGAVSRLPSSHSTTNNGQFHNADSVYDSDRPHTPVHVCANSIKRHIIKPNTDGGDTTFDLFLHTWSFDLEAQFKEAYQDSNLKLSQFEDNRKYESVMKLVYPQFSWPEISFTISVQKAVKLMLKFESLTHISYDRVLIVRPDIFIMKDLILAKLKRGPQDIYCNYFGRAGGDFHFVMEHSQAERVSTALPMIDLPTASSALATAGTNLTSIMPKDSKAYVLGNHGNMKKFALEEMDATMKNDDQIFAGFDEEVYRKVPWNLMLCNAADWWRHYMLVNYGMTDEDWSHHEVLAKSTRHCVPHEPAFIMNRCCRHNATCTPAEEPIERFKECGGHLNMF